MKITVKQIMDWEPCEEYPESRVIELVGDGKTPLEICDLDIPAEDKLWVLFRPEFIPEKILTELWATSGKAARKSSVKAAWEAAWKSADTTTSEAARTTGVAIWAKWAIACEVARESQLNIVKKTLIKLQDK
jgi:hypothetical protein